MEAFKLKNLVLYSKNHYVKSDNFWLDLAKILDADDYNTLFGENGTEYRKMDIAYIIINTISKWMAHRNNYEHRFIELLKHASPQECFKVGYTCKGNYWENSPDLPEYDYWRAMVMAHISELSMASLIDLGWENWCEPSDKILPITRVEAKKKLLKDIKDIEDFLANPETSFTPKFEEDYMEELTLVIDAKINELQKLKLRLTDNYYQIN